MERLLFFLISFLFLSVSKAQDPGIVLNKPGAYHGYTILAPSTANVIYLIDNCGQVVNEWESDFKPGLSTYLDIEGNLIRPKRVLGNVFNAGGIGGGIEKFNWDGKLIWSIEIANEEEHQHHDIEIMPNGNFLVLAWDRRSKEDALSAGRMPSLIPENGIWPEKIFEIKPIGIDSAEVVWEWYLWNHLVQDFDSLAENYGDVSANPGKLDINFFGTDVAPANPQADWIHANSLDYNPKLDQILFSSRNMNEVFVIDHSTTSLEAASDSGGKYGKGGNFLYRYGNPQSYKMGDESDRILFSQHDAHWVEAGLPGEGNIMLFNNGIGRLEGNISTVIEFVPPIDVNGNYILNDSIYGPEELLWSYGLGEDDFEFFSHRISGVQRQPNGNSLICIGNEGTFIEIDKNKDIVWYYINPLRSGTPVEIGQQLSQNEVFRAYKYGADFDGFANKELIAGPRLEISKDPVPCELFPFPLASAQVKQLKEKLIISNPVETSIYLLDDFASGSNYLIYDLSGELKQKGILNIGQKSIDASFLPSGMYIIHLQNQNAKHFSSEKFIKL